ncbi:hypothetical protein HBDW_11430 [Herbaspirillum sp. DW155]|uniref:hypothetical protein n=1 Tax=Herbaspirillum sp. DW155 TaxID=3095609 RepID=UPI003090C87E|nr:hypothetical protein HBDW_11430 [Herbaspirillum sp. DW155]
MTGTRLAARLIQLFVSMAIIGCSATDATQVARAHTDRTLLKAIVLGMGSEGASVTDARYDRYFGQGSAAAGVAAVIAAGRFLVNGLAIPATETDCARRFPDGYPVNQTPWLRYDDKVSAWRGGYQGEKVAGSYAAAALAVATGIVPGLEVRLYDTDRDGHADLIEADFKEGVQVGRIIRNDDGTYSVTRGDIDTANTTAVEGRTFDGTRFTATSGERIAARDFDTTLAPGDIALFWHGPDGWILQRAREVHGVFVDGMDHRRYDIDGTAYADAMRFSRNNLLISNRPGEYANAQKYFGLNDNHEGLKVSLWLVPTRDLEAHGAPVGITSGASARRLLARAVAIARQKLGDVVVSVDGKDVPSTAKWVHQDAYRQLSDAIARAEGALASAASSPALLDYQIYLLYLTLNGSDGDIGARFGGYRYAGFDHAILTGTRAP